jgi:hypothetical protein
MSGEHLERRPRCSNAAAGPDGLAQVEGGSPRNSLDAHHDSRHVPRRNLRCWNSAIRWIVFLGFERARGCLMSLNDPRTPRGPLSPRDPRGSGFGVRVPWLWILIIIIIIIGLGWGGYHGRWWGSGGAHTASSPPAQTTGQGTASRPAQPAPATPAPAGK